MTSETAKEIFYSLIELTEEEKDAAILEGKKRKYFKSQHSAYWQSLEEKKIKKGHVTNL